jgi:lysophospholipase L1-like esterase
MHKLTRRVVVVVMVLRLAASAAAEQALASRPLIIALGDSITYGFGLPHPSTQNYAVQYARRMHSRVVDLAVPGYACVDVMQREVPKMPPGGSVVIVNCGTNDIGGFGFSADGLPDGHKRAAPATVHELQDSERTFTRMLSEIRKSERNASIIVLTLRHMQRMTGVEDSRFAADVDEWNKFIRIDGVRVVDISADRRMYQPMYFQQDLIHPNLAGNEAILDDLGAAAR